VGFDEPTWMRSLMLRIVKVQEEFHGIPRGQMFRPQGSHPVEEVQEECHGIPRGQMFRPQGPHPVEDAFVMMTAVVILDHSLNAGIIAATVKFNTIRKT
jgi:hypothetical protein